jgi:hypothetical protein
MTATVEEIGLSIIDQYRIFANRWHRDIRMFREQETMMDILSANSKKEYPKSVTELLRLEEKRFLQVPVTS